MTTTFHNHETVPDLHVGHGISYGGLTIFPVWTPGPDRAERRYTLSEYEAGERAGGPSVPSLTLTSTGSLPTLVLEGTVLEGGWQHRVLLHSVLMAPGQKLDVDVACVEAGRWRGGKGHRVGRRRAPSAVRGASYGLRPETAGRERPAEYRSSDQSDIWRRVRYYERTYGQSNTSSLVELGDRMEHSAHEVPTGAFSEPSPEPLPGQHGVIVGVAGHPLLLELFDSTRALAEQWESIIQAAKLDAGTVQPARVPAWRARAFADRITGAPMREVARRGIADEVVAEDLSLFTARGIRYDGDLLHLTAVNVKHELVLAA